MRNEIRVLGIDDSPFDPYKKKNVLVVAVFYRGGKFLDGILSTNIRKDGVNATIKVASMVNKSKFRSQLRAILLDGISLGGFNILDINELYRKTKIPVIVVMRNYPNIHNIFQALKKINKEKRMKLIIKAGQIYKVNKIHIQIAGTTVENARNIIRITTTNSNIPEPLRIAHIIATGIIKGESHGRA
jgi:uncharacterized protein